MPGWKVNVKSSVDGNGQVAIFVVNIEDEHAAMDAALNVHGGSHAASEKCPDELITHYKVAPGEAKHILTMKADGFGPPKAN